jgi:Tol biopolymer transport system component
VIVAKDGVARIIDFGLAKSHDATATLDGTTKGTPLYMSPEQASGKPVDYRTDLWSLGAVLYEMLAGRPPFQGETPLQVMRAVTQDEPPALRTLRPELPPGVDAIAARALQKDPAARYQSAAEVARDLSAALAGQALASVTVAQPALGARRRAISLAAALAVLAAAALLAWRFGRRPGPATSASEYIQITNFADSGCAPALSPDGRMLTFFRGGAYFLGDGQVYVKLLPDGESKQLTNSSNAKYDPVFTPDGSRVAYTELQLQRETVSWDTWTVPVLGGPPARLMANAAGLSWVSPDRVLFSEIMAGTVLHMGIVTAKESRAEERRIYFPAHERAMAHYSWPSPDRSSVLIVEMDPSQAWLRCRVTPMDGKSAGIQVGPAGACTAAGWSPDGRWMYLNAMVGGASHLWRQRWRNHAPDGEPQQITFGPTEEEGLAVAPDGKSLIASVGVRQSSVWTHDSAGDRMVSQEGSASAPALSADGKRLYYLLQKSNRTEVKDLWQRDLVSGNSRSVLPGLPIVDYDISRDETQVAYTAVGAGNEKEIFMVAADRSTPPRQVVRGGDSVSFGAGGQLIFRQLGAHANYLARIQTDGSGLERIQNLRISDKTGASPDGNWVVTGDADGVSGAFAVSLKGQVRCQLCTGQCDAKWSPDGKYLYLTVGDPKRSKGQTYIIPIPRGVGLLDLPRDGLDAVGGLSGMRSIPGTFVAPGPDPQTYAFARSEFRGNLFRIPLH